MKVGSIKFGARIDIETYNMLLNARKRGLNTQKAEDLMSEVCPLGTIYTVNVDNKINGKRNKGIKTMGISSYYMQKTIDVLPLKIETIDNIDYFGKAYKLNQETIDLITKNLIKIKNKQSKYRLKVKSLKELELLAKFGEPVSDR